VLQRRTELLLRHARLVAHHQPRLLPPVAGCAVEQHGLNGDEVNVLLREAAKEEASANPNPKARLARLDGRTSNQGRSLVMRSKSRTTRMSATLHASIATSCHSEQLSSAYETAARSRRLVRRGTNKHAAVERRTAPCLGERVLRLRAQVLVDDHAINLPRGKRGERVSRASAAVR